MDDTNQAFRLADNRGLGFAEYGDRAGVPVFHFHGSASSRLERPADTGTLKASGFRFITVDRPGHGLSDFQPERRLTSWVQDIVQLADHLHINDFFVTGHSAGGPHALACAHELPTRVIAGAVISSVAPMSRKDAYSGMPILNQLLARASRKLPWLTYQIRRLMRRMVMRDGEAAARRLMASLPACDKDTLFAGENMEIFIASIREGFCQGYQGAALDDILVNSEWGFPLEGIRPRIDIWHGEEDVNVPIHAGHYLAVHLPNKRGIFLPGKGHFFIMNQWVEILSTLAGEG